MPTAAPNPGCGRDVNLCSVAVELRSAAQTRHRTVECRGEPALWPGRLIIRARKHPRRLAASGAREGEEDAAEGVYYAGDGGAGYWEARRGKCAVDYILPYCFLIYLCAAREWLVKNCLGDTERFILRDY